MASHDFPWYLMGISWEIFNRGGGALIVVDFPSKTRYPLLKLLHWFN
jgi:hypothetical protein